MRIEHDEAVSGSVEKGGQLGEFGLRVPEFCRFAVRVECMRGVHRACGRFGVLVDRRRDIFFACRTRCRSGAA
jgi:hypothetical protein